MVTFFSNAVRTTVLCSALFSGAFTSAQTIEWQNTIGGINDDFLSIIEQTSDGRYVVGGTSSSGLTGNKTDASNGNKDYWILKLDTDGTIIWQNCIGGSLNDELSVVRETSDGGFIMGGWSISPISGEKTEAVVGAFDYWVVKVDAAGVIEWQNVIGGTGTDELRDIHQTSDGGYIIGGTSNSNISGDKTENSMGFWDYWILKISSTGVIEWQNTIGGSGTDYLYTVCPTSDGGYILGGRSDSPISGDKTEGTAGMEDYWAVKVNGSGVVVWQNTIGGSANDALQSIEESIDGGFILGGYSGSGISGEKTEALIGSFDYWVMKLNSSGLLQWQNTIGGSSTENMWSLEEIADGSIKLGGSSGSGIDGDKTEANIGSYDYWMVTLDDLGNILSQQAIGATGTDYLLSCYSTDDSGWILGGYSNSADDGHKTDTCWGGYDYWVVKLIDTACVDFTVTYDEATDTVCSIDGPVSLTPGFPAGGTYTGPGTTVSGDIFTPDISFLGPNEIIYSFYDSLTGCQSSDTSYIVVEICGGLTESETSNGLIIQPNPNRGSFTVSAGVDGRFVVYSAVGAILFEGELNQPVTVDLAPGVYFVSCQNGQQILTSRLVVDGR